MSNSDKHELLDGIVVANFGASVAIEDANFKLYTCTKKKNLPQIVCGDRVKWVITGENSGHLESLCDRTSLLARQDLRNKRKPIAANIDQIIIVNALNKTGPPINTRLTDRYIVAAEINNIRPVLLINKIDLLPNEQHATLIAMLERYRKIGYESYSSSVNQAIGIDTLIDCLKDKTSIFTGESGVGKSSLINEILPDANLRVGALSKVSGMGRHTTSTTTLYHLPEGGNIIDSPGIRDFALWDIAPEQLSHGFREFHPYECRFRNCRHQNEPGCEVRKAVKSDVISSDRYDSYIEILTELNLEACNRF